MQVKSKAQKRQEAVEKISNYLREQTVSNQQKIVADIENKFDENYRAVSTAVINYFEQLIEMLKDIYIQFENNSSTLLDVIKLLNNSYAKRILDWSSYEPILEPLNENTIQKTIVEVQREFAKCILIKTQKNLDLKFNLETIKQVIQEDIDIIAPEVVEKFDNTLNKEKKITNQYNKMSNFQLGNLAGDFETALAKLYQWLQSLDQEQLLAKLDNEIEEHSNQSFLTVTFIGQYSAGKSTIISALTGNRDIYIDADIATDKTSSYDWNGIKLIDTPGLFTDRKDHDAITYETISKSDLLVFCLTYMLFDSITVENFKKLAYELHYRWKIILVVNKMSDEAGKDDEKIQNYRTSIIKALKPYDISNLAICFIDAKDYIDGVDQEDNFLVDISRFNSFTSELNQFVGKYGTAARLDTPVRIALKYINETQINLLRDSNEDEVFFEVLNHLDRKITQEREQLYLKIKTLALETGAYIIREGNRIVDKIGQLNQEEQDELVNSVQANIEKKLSAVEKECQEIYEKAVKSLQDTIKLVLDSDLVSILFERLKFKENFKNLKQQIKFLEKIGNKVGLQLTELATNKAMGAGQVFLRFSNVAGSTLHNSIYTVGKIIGFKFKPWQAVNLAKNIGNVVKFVGPVLSLVSLGLEIYDIRQQEEQSQKIAQAQKEVTTNLISGAKEIESLIEQQFQIFDKQQYQKIEKDIADAREEQEREIAQSNHYLQDLIAIRADFQNLLDRIREIPNPKENI